LDQLSGEAPTGAQKVAFQLTDQFLNLMIDPFVDGHSGVGGGRPPGPASTARLNTVPPICQRPSLLPIIGSRPIASPSTIALRPTSTRRATAGDSKAAIVSQRHTQGSRLTPRSRRRVSTSGATRRVG
jgi:hypothetical protein